jgi:hypothetical protein
MKTTDGKHVGVGALTTIEGPHTKRIKERRIWITIDDTTQLSGDSSPVVLGYATLSDYERIVWAP